MPDIRRSGAPDFGVMVKFDQPRRPILKKGKESIQKIEFSLRICIRIGMIKLQLRQGAVS
jgi:hypothetical protein